MATWQIVLYTILGLLAAFLAITLIRAAFFTPKNRPMIRCRKSRSIKAA